MDCKTGATPEIGELHPILIHLLERKTRRQRCCYVEFGGIGTANDDSGGIGINQVT